MLDTREAHGIVPETFIRRGQGQGLSFPLTFPLTTVPDCVSSACMSAPLREHIRSHDQSQPVGRHAGPRNIGSAFVAVLSEHVPARAEEKLAPPSSHVSRPWLRQQPVCGGTLPHWAMADA